MQVSKEEWQRMFDKLHHHAQNFPEPDMHFSDCRIPLSGRKGRKRWLLQSNVVELYHYLDIPCNELDELPDEDKVATCLAITSSNGEESYFIGRHVVGECPHKEDDPLFGRFPDEYEWMWA